MHPRLNIKPFLFRTLRNVPMSVIALGVGLITGILMWFILDRVQVFRMERIVDGELQAQLEQRANESMIRFENHVYGYLIITRLLANQLDYTAISQDNASFTGEAKALTGYPPGWTKNILRQTELPPPVLVMLADAQGSIHNIYSNGIAAEDLAKIQAQASFKGTDTTLIGFEDKRLYLQITVALSAEQGGIGQHAGYLRAIFPLDREFLAKSQLGIDEDWSVVALIDTKTSRVIASLDEGDIPIGMLPSDWQGHYVVATQPLTTIQPENVQYEFATFISQARVDRILRQLTILDWRQRFYTASLFVLVFTVLMVLISSRLNKMVRRMTIFSQKALGVQPNPRFQHSGNQLVLLEDWVNHFTQLVLMSRDEANRQHEAEMRQTEALKAAVMEASLDAIVTLDQEGKIIEFNAAAVTLFSISRDQAIGLDFTDHFIVDAGRDYIKTLINSAQQVPHEPTHYRELNIVDARGEHIPVDMSIVQIMQGDHDFYTLYIHDIRADKAAAAQIESLARFVRENPDPVLRIDRDGILVDANEPSQALLENWHVSIGAQFPQEYVTLVKNILQTGRPDAAEIEIDKRLFSLLLVPVVDLGYVNVYARDISAQRQAEQAFRQQQAALIHVSRVQSMGEMATGLAHELNQPLSAIVNYANGCIRRLQNEETNPTTLLPALEQISQQGRRAGDIIRQLRVMVGRQPAQRAPTQVMEMVNDVLSFMNHERSHHEIQIEVHAEDPDLSVFADKVQLEQVLLNLVANAIDVLKDLPPEERKLSISLKREQDQALIEVADNGPGIKPEFIDKVFDAFATTKSEGMGMGLAISKTIVENHDGHIWASSDQNQGAVFHLLLPLYSTADASTDQEE